ncbi:MAG: MBL fold metallo-hydrolase [Bacteroidales bacterium]|nr:MAG: MBL fold metallo-hydrolase [Bacteroidales bacterium]
MKKTIKRILWGLGIILALLFLFFGWYGYRASSEMKKLRPVETAYLIDSIYTIKDDIANVYLIKNGNSYVSIDAGNSAEGIKEGLKKLNINPDDIAAVLLTHTDGDHVNGLSVFAKATVYISKQEEQMVNGETSRFAFFKNSLSGRAYTTIEDGQVIDLLSSKIQGILVPGHTPGSMCFLVNEKYLFIGDALSLKDGKIDRFNQFFNMDSETAAKSTAKLTQLPNAQYIFTAHYGYSNDYKNAVLSWK